MLSTPTRQRSTVSQSRPPPSARGRSTPRASAVRDLPPYETPEAPLTADGQRQLSALLHSQALTQLNTHLAKSVELLTTSAGEVTTQLIDAQNRYQTLKEKRRNARQNTEGGGNEEVDEAEDEDEEFQLLGEKEQKVGEVTARMEEKMRQLVDSETRLSELKDSVHKIEKEEAEALSAAIGVRQTRGQRRLQRRRQQRDDDDDDDDEEDSQDENYEGTPEREIREGNAQNPPSRRFENALANGTQEWNSMSLTDRYASHNNYVGFYKVVHDSKYTEGEAPLLPHSSTWFSHMEDTSGEGVSSEGGGSSRQAMRTRNNREPSPAESDDLAIQRERISLKCPLTLLPFRDPVTSTKCPHSFEREAITDMISRSSRYGPDPTREGRRLRAVKCPVCSNLLTVEDLRSDPVILRKVKRAEELAAREQDYKMDGSGGEEDDGNEVTSGSDADSSDEDGDAMDVDAYSDSVQPRIKSEPVARIKRESTMIPNASQDVEEISSDESE